MAEYLPDSDSLTGEATTVTRDFRARLLCEQDVCFFGHKWIFLLKKGLSVQELFPFCYQTLRMTTITFGKVEGRGCPEGPQHAE